MLDLLSSLLGFPCDDEKSVSDSIQMLLLGVDVAVRWADKLVELVVAKEKAALWASDLEAALETRTMKFWWAGNMTGRLSLAVTASGLRLGRALVEPFFMPRRTSICDNSVAVRESSVPSVGGGPTGATALQRATHAR